LLLTAGGTIQTTSTVVNPQTINAPLVLGGDYSFNSSASSPTTTLHFGGEITPSATNGTTTLTLTGNNSGPNTIAGSLADNGAAVLAVVKTGTGLWILSGANTYSGGTTVAAGTLRFDVTSGTPSVAAGATATVNDGATLELAGSISALSSGANRENVANNSNAPGVLVSGTNQRVGSIDGSGTTQVNAGSDLTANDIIQTALVIDGTASSRGLVTIAASDSLGNPLAGLANREPSLAPETRFGATSVNSSIIPGVAFASSDPIVKESSAAATAVPEPSSLALLIVSSLALGGPILRRRHADLC
jgi:fibronectin-binding autotransporter adhesin